MDKFDDQLVQIGGNINDQLVCQLEIDFTSFLEVRQQDGYTAKKLDLPKFGEEIIISVSQNGDEFDYNWSQPTRAGKPASPVKKQTSLAFARPPRRR